MRLDATIAFPPKDTVRLSLPASTSWCSGRGAVVLESLSPEGSGVLVRIRYRDSLASDSLPIVTPEDTTTIPAAVVGVRFFLHETPHGYSLDSGTVRVRRTGRTIAVIGSGTGVESAIRIHARVAARDVPLGTDSVSCAYGQ